MDKFFYVRTIRFGIHKVLQRNFAQFQERRSHSSSQQGIVLWAYYWYSITTRAEKNSSEDRTINAVAQIVFLFEQQCVAALFE